MTAQHPQPTLIVLTGRPGSGKTYLAHKLASAIRCPALCRDELKEGFVHTTGVGRDEDNRLIYDAFFETIDVLLKHRITHIAEAAFQHKLWQPKLDPLRPHAQIKIIICQIDDKLARSRHIARGLADPDRERFHSDAPVQAAREGRELPIGEYDPPHLDVPTLTVDTTNGYTPAFSTIVSFARHWRRDRIARCAKITIRAQRAKRRNKNLFPIPSSKTRRAARG